MASPLSPITIPPNSPMVPDWAREAVHRLNLLTASTIGIIPDTGGVGGNAFGYSAANAQLLIPGGYTGRAQLAKLTSGGEAGYIEFKNGRVTAVQQPT